MKRNIIGLMVGIILLLTAGLTAYAYTPSAQLTSKIDTVVTKLEASIDKKGESYRSKLITRIESIFSKYSSNEAITYVGDTLVEKLQANAKTSTNSTTTAGATSTKNAVENADWDDNVEITFDDTTFTTFLYESNGLPDSSYLGEKYLIPNSIASQPFSDNDESEFTTVYASEYFKESPISTTITLFPKYSDTTTPTSLGQIGVTLNGAALFNDYENMELTLVALDDNIIHDHAAFVDECNGHSLQNGDSYHYHGVPTCITENVDIEGTHSTMIGVLQDGFPVYGNKDTSGVEITSDELDACSGHFGVTPEFSEGIYHYHLTTDKAPYSIDCYHGEVTLEISTQMGPPNGNTTGGQMAPQQGATGQGAPGFAAAAIKLGITEATLEEALGTSRPPDLAAAAKKLGITETKLQEALGVPPHR